MFSVGCSLAKHAVPPKNGPVPAQRRLRHKRSVIAQKKSPTPEPSSEVGLSWIPGRSGSAGNPCFATDLSTGGGLISRRDFAQAVGREKVNDQAPMTNEYPSTNVQAAVCCHTLGIGDCRLVIPWSLVLGHSSSPATSCSNSDTSRSSSSTSGSPPPCFSASTTDR